ncbi:hypothetical protein ACFWPX_36345 [Nocardia sp. NPDC058518]|uniref:hypothetical protein n=1 Tax=Nocardia sp. NPDC058518 TaxID=3346534 RepID=UPI00364CD6F2
MNYPGGPAHPHVQRPPYPVPGYQGNELPPEPGPGYPRTQYPAPGYAGYPQPQPPKRNKGLIIAAVIGAGVLGATALGAMVYRGVTDPHGRSEIDDLTVGRCVDRPSTTDVVYSLPTRSCDKPHDGEVLYVGHLTEWTDETAARQAATSLCFNATPVIEATENPAVSEVTSYGPLDESSFRKSRAVQCIAWAAPGVTLKAPLTER